MIKSGSLGCKRHSRHFLPVLGCLVGRARVAVGFGVGEAGPVGFRASVAASSFSA